MALTYLDKLRSKLDVAKTDDELFKAVVNAPFSDPLQAANYDLGVMVLLLVNKKTRTIDRIALSDTLSAKGAVTMSVKPFDAIKIPLEFPNNAIAKAIKTDKPQHVVDWQYLFIPDLTPKEARLNQAGAGIECSCVYPLHARDGGALIYSIYEPLQNVTDAHREFARAYTRLVDDRLSATASQLNE